MTDRYAGLTSDEADRLMSSIISEIVREELIAARAITAEEWAAIDLQRRCDTIAGGIWCAVENRRAGAPHEPFQARSR